VHNQNFIDEFDKTRIKQMASQGIFIYEIAKSLKISKPRIKKIIVELGLQGQYPSLLEKKKKAKNAKK
jgi:hypothetical protein